MNGFVFALAVPPWALLGAVVAVIVVAAVVLLRGVGGGVDPQAAGAGADEQEVCPRCHHRNPADATRCPECGKSL